MFSGILSGIALVWWMFGALVGIGIGVVTIVIFLVLVIAAWYWFCEWLDRSEWTL